MGLLAPLLLLATVALAVPIAIHLFRREDTRARSFPALRYLARSIEDRSRTMKLHQLMLLLVRLLIVTLIVLAAARLILPLGGGEHPPASVVLIVDNGVHSGAVVEGERIWDHLVRRGGEMLDALGPLDRVWVVAGGSPWRPALPLTPPEAREALSALEPTGVLSAVPRLLDRARALLSAAPDGPVQIVLLSTLASATFERDGEIDPVHGTGGLPSASAWVPDSPVLLQGPGVALPANRGIAEFRIGGGLSPRAGESSLIEVRVEGEEHAEIPVRLILDGELVAAARTDSDGRATFGLPARNEGWLEGIVELDPDALRADDHRSFTALIRPPPAVRVEGAPGAHLREALETLGGAGRILLLAGDAPDAEVVLHTGGGDPAMVATGSAPTRVIMPPLDLSRLPASNRLLEEWGVQWRMVLTGSEARTPLAPATGFPPSLAGIEVSQRIRLEPLGAGDGEIEVRRDDGSPWLVRARGRDTNGLATVVIVASSLDPEVSDLPLSAAMIPFLDRLLTPAGTGSAEASGGSTGHLAGLPLVLPPGTGSVRTPDGTLIPADGMPRILDTGIPGRYEILDEAGALLRPVAVHVSGEAVRGSGSYSTAEAATRLGDGVDPASDGSGWTRDVLGDRRGREVAPILGILVLFLILLEGWLAGRLTSTPKSPLRRATTEGAEGA